MVRGSIALLVLVLAGPARGATVPHYEGSAAEQAAQKAGWRTLRTLRADITGDGRREDVVVQSGAPGLRLAILTYVGGDVDDDPGAYQTVYQQTIPAARKVLRLQTQPVAGDPHDDLVAVFESPSPDERAVTVTLVGRADAKVISFFRRTYVNATVEPPDRVSLGHAAPHFVLKDIDGDGTQEVLWTFGPQLLQVKGPSGPVDFVIGARQGVFRFDASRRRYLETGEETVVDFLPPRVPTEVEATQQVPKIWGTAQAFWGADGDLETAWTVSNRTAAGQALTLRFSDRPKVSMIRVVPGCGGTADDWARFYAVDRFRLHLASGLRLELQADGKGPWPIGVRGMGVFPLAAGFGRQLLVFLDEPASIAWGRLEVVAARRPSVPKKRRIAEVCVSEISFH